FFQAEDGIRDATVTGVQTCALPILLDVRLPDLDGKAIWRRLLVDRPALAARVVFMTGDTMSAETQAFLTEAGRPVLTKPLTIERIQRAVNEALTAPSVHEGART